MNTVVYPLDSKYVIRIYAWLSNQEPNISIMTSMQGKFLKYNVIFGNIFQ